MPDPFEQLSEDLTTVSRIVPDATPGVVYGLAQTEDPAGAALATRGMTEAIFMRDALLKMDDKQQLSTYERLGDAHHRMLSQVGYLAPHQRPDNRGWWQRTLDVVKDIPGAVTGTVAGAVSGAATGALFGAATLNPAGVIAGLVVGGAVGAVRGAQEVAEGGGPLQSLAWVQEDILHAYRTVKLLETENRSRGKSAWMPWTWTDVEFGRAWEETGDEFLDFSKEPEQALREFDVQVSERAMPVVVDVARGMNEVDLVAKYGAQALAQLQEEPEFERAVVTIQSFALSPGRQLAHGLGISAISKPGEKVRLPVVGLEVSPFDFYSGLGDGLVRWYGDPVNVGFGGLKLGKKGAERLVSARGIEVGSAEGQALVQSLSRSRANIQAFARERALARYGIRDASDVARVSQFPETQRAYQRIVQHFAEGGDGAAGVIREFPDLTMMAEDFARLKPQNVDDVQELFEAKAGIVAVMGGRAAGFASVEPVVPHLGKLSPGIKRFSETLQRGIEALEDVPVVRKGAIGFRRFTNLVPASRVIDPTDAKSTELLRQTALYSFKRREADQLVNAWLAADVAGKRKVYLGMMRELSRRLGGDDIPEVRKVFDRIIGGIEGSFRRPYGINAAGDDVSRVVREGTRGENLAIAEHQLTQAWALPDFREIVQARRTMALYKRIPGMGHIPDGLIDGVMERVWKPLVLLRLGFPIRAGGEEVARTMLAEGFIPTLRSRLAASTIRSWEKQRLSTYGRAPDFDKMGSSWRGVRDYLADNTFAALRRIKTGAFAPLAGERYLHAAERALLRYGPEMVPKNVTAFRDVGGAMDRPEEIARRLKDSRGRERVVRFRPGRTWKNYAPTDEFQTQAWQDELARHMRDKSFRTYLDNIDDPARAEEALFRYLKSDEAAEIRSLSPRSKPETVGVATQDEALRDWARTMRQSYEGLTHDMQGQVVREVVDVLRGKVTAEVVGVRGAKDLNVRSAELLVGADDLGRVPTVDELARLPFDKRPLAVAGREVLPVFASWWEGLVTSGFKPVGRMINWISRQPIFIHEYAKAIDEVAPIAARLRASGTKVKRTNIKTGGRFEVAADKLADEWAWNMAAERTYKLIDNSELRSQFKVMHQNLFPFWHAQEQFVKRWARTILKDPSVVRRAQLTMAGLRHAGALHRDENGDDFFFYPGAMFAQGVLAKASNTIFGTDIQTAIPIALTGKVRFAAPGIESPRATFVPSPSPIVSLPLAFARTRFPSLRAVIGDIEETALGSELARDRPIWEQLVPTTIARAIKVFKGPESEGQIASAMAQAIQHLEATGQGLPETATPEEQQEFQDRAEQTARIIVALRGIYGFTVPATPQVEFTANLSDEFLSTLNRVGDFEEATTEFLAKNPGATAYTVFKTETTARGIRLDPTQQTREFIEKNKGFIDKYGSISAWFIPDAPGKFEFRAWMDQFAYEFRRRKDTKELWTDIKVAEAANIYYPSRDAYEQAASQVQGLAKEELDARWQAWKQAFFNLHPIFHREHIAIGEQRSIDRRNQLSRVSEALQDPTRPQTPSEAAIRNVVLGWQAYNEAMVGLRGDRSSAAVARRRALTAAFKQWGAAQTDQRAQAFFRSLIEPELGR